jgi:hypothetical protein
MARWPETRATTDADGWTERYGCYSKTFGGHYSVSVAHSTNRETPGYVVRIADVTLKALSPDVEDGKRRGVAALRRMLEQALADLPPMKSGKAG